MNSKQKQNLSRFFLYLITIIITLIMLVPFYILIVNSFKSQTEIIENILAFPQVFTIDNYTETFVELNFIQSAYYSLVVTITSVSAIIVFSSMLAWQLMRNKTKASKFIFVTLIFSMLVPFHSIMFPLVQVTDILGVNGAYTMWLVYLGQGTAMASFLFHGYVKSIPLEVEEAAHIDGATPFQSFRFVVFPLLKPMSITIAVLNIMWVWNDYLMPRLVLNNVKTLPISIQSFNSGIYGKQMDLMITAVVIMLVPVITFYAFAQKYVIEGMTSGSIK